MGCGSSNATLEKKEFKKTGDSKKDFFYCFDDEEIKLIEERRNNILSTDSKLEELYDKFELDYINEKDDTINVKQYLALYVSNYTGIFSQDTMQNFNCSHLEIKSFKINNKEAELPEINQSDDYLYIDISCKISENQKEEPFKDLLILEYTYKLKQIRHYNTRSIYLFKRDDPYTYTVIVYYDKKKMIIESNGEINLTSSKNSDKYFNQKQVELWIRNKEIKFSKEEEALIKKKFSSQEIKKIYDALNKIGTLKGQNLVFEQFKYVFNKNGIKGTKGEGKFLYLINKRENFIDGGTYSTYYKINEIKVNDKPITKKKWMRN